MQKIVFSDVDGTLLNSRHELTPLTEQAIRTLKEDSICDRICQKSFRDLFYSDRI